MKTVTIEYASGDANCLCNAGVTGKRAEDKCLKQPKGFFLLNKSIYKQS